MTERWRVEHGDCRDLLRSLPDASIDSIVLDPFTGSGSTGKGALLEGLQFVGFEQSADYVAIAQARIRYAQHHDG